MCFQGPPIDPPDPPMECSWCDGQTELEVASVYDSLGNVHVLATAFVPHVMQDFPLVICPNCKGMGTEPEQEEDPDRQRDEAWDREQELIDGPYYGG